MVEGTFRLRLSESWQVGGGALWGTFAADVPEFAVFAPLDHDPWLEYNMVFGELRHVSRRAAAVRQFVGGRLGVLRELAEFAGAEIRRTGIAVGGVVGLDWRVRSRLSLQLSTTLLTASLGSGQLRNVEGTARGALSPYWGLRAGFEVWFGD